MRFDAMMLTHDGRTQPIRSWAAELRLARGTIYWRLSRGMSIEDALKPVQVHRPREKRERKAKWPATKVLTYNGQRKSLQTWACDIGIEMNSLHRRLTRWGVEAALSTPAWGRREKPPSEEMLARIDTINSPPKKRCSKFLEFRGRRLSVTQWADELNIDRVTLISRLKMGWTVERALSTPVRKINRRNING